MLSDAALSNDTFVREPVAWLLLPMQRATQCSSSGGGCPRPPAQCRLAWKGEALGNHYGMDLAPDRFHWRPSERSEDWFVEALSPLMSLPVRERPWIRHADQLNG